MSRDESILQERIGGAKLREIGERHGLTREGVRLVAVREAERHLRQVMSDIHDAQRTGDILLFGIPAADPSEQQQAITYLQWVLAHLPEFGADVRVHYRPCPDGALGFGLEDLNYRAEEGADQ